jgi:hypothetical protein
MKKINLSYFDTKTAQNIFKNTLLYIFIIQKCSRTCQLVEVGNPLKVIPHPLTKEEEDVATLLPNSRSVFHLQCCQHLLRKFSRRSRAASCNVQSLRTLDVGKVYLMKNLFVRVTFGIVLPRTC